MKHWNSFSFNLKLLFVGIILSILLLTSDEFWFAKLPIFFTVVWISGYFLISNLLEDYSFNLIEFIVVSFTVGLAVFTLLSRYLLQFEFFVFNRGAVALVVCVLLVVGYFISSKKKIEFRRSSGKEYILELLIILIPLLVISDDIFRWWEFQFALDAWSFKQFVFTVLHQNPFEKWFSFYGFYTINAFIVLLSGVSVHFLSKLIVLLILPLVTYFVYLIVKSFFIKEAAFLSSILFLYPIIVIVRFKMPLRENLAFLFLLCFIYLLMISMTKTNNKKELNHLPTSLLISSILVTHPIVSLFAVLFILSAMIYYKGAVIKTIILGTLFSTVSLFEIYEFSIKYSNKYFSNFIENYSFYLVLFIIVLTPLVIAVRHFRFKREDIPLKILLIIFLTITLLGETLNLYSSEYKFNPPEVFKDIILLFGFFGLFVSFKNRAYPGLRGIINSLIVPYIVLTFIIIIVSDLEGHRIGIYMALMLALFSGFSFDFIIRSIRDKNVKLVTLSLLTLVILSLTITTAVNQDLQPRFFNSHFICANDIINRIDEKNAILINDLKGQHVFTYLEYYNYDKSLSYWVFKRDLSKDELIKKVKKRHPDINEVYLVDLDQYASYPQLKNLGEKTEKFNCPKFAEVYYLNLNES